MAREHAEDRPIDELNVADLRRFPVWEYVDANGSAEVTVRPVPDVPVRDARSRVFATQVRLANGQLPWATVGNIDVDDARSTEHFLTISIERSGAWFHLARYHDVDHGTRGPSALAQFLGLGIQDVFSDPRRCATVRRRGLPSPQRLRAK
jgi:hypothetical protein